MNEINDYELVYMIRQGDDYAYRELYNRYLPMIWRIVYDYQNCYSAYFPDASESFNECLAAFDEIVHAYRYDKKALFGTYLYRRIDQTMKNYRRTTERRYSEIYNEESEFIDLFETLPDRSLEFDPVSIYKMGEIKKTVAIVLENFDEEEQIIIKDIINGVSIAEIAREKNEPRKKFDYILARFRENVSKMLETKEYN